jgi:hypothetical protein
MEWELKYPRVMVQALTREILNHSPLLIDSGQPPKQNKANLFKFELSWLLKEEFYELVTEVWHKENRGSSSLEKWHNKIRHLRRYLQGWAKNLNGTYKKERQDLITRLEQMDKKAETAMLTPQELDLKHCLKARLVQLLREEEVKWYQR